jgi:hypothetical protein
MFMQILFTSFDGSDQHQISLLFPFNDVTSWDIWGNPITGHTSDLVLWLYKDMTNTVMSRLQQ